MSKIFALLAVLLIVTGILVLAVPREAGQPMAPRPESSLSPQAMKHGTDAQSLLRRARDIAEQANAPLSILFGLVSLYYSRRTYNINRERLGAGPGNSA